MINCPYVAAAARVSVQGVSGERGGATDPDPGRVPRAAAAIQGAENPGYRRLLRLGAREQPRARRTRAAESARAGRRERGRGLREGVEAQPQGARVGALLRGGARAGAAAHVVDPVAAVRESP